MFGWILLSLLGLLLLLMIIPVGLELRYKDDELRLRARVLGFKMMLIPAKPKKARKPRKEKSEKEPDAPKEPKKKEPIPTMDMLQTINDLLPELGRLVGSLLRHMTVKRLRVQLPVGGEDAAEVGIHYGQMQVLCYNIYVYLASATRLKEWKLSLQPDWTGEFPAPLVAELWLRATPLTLLAILLRFLLRGGVILYRSPYIQVTHNANKSRTKKIKIKDGAKDASDPHR